MADDHRFCGECGTPANAKVLEEVRGPEGVVKLVYRAGDEIWKVQGIPPEDLYQKRIS